MDTFWKWIAKDSPLTEVDRLLALIRQSGRQGITRGSLGGNIRLEKETLDQLLAALIGARQITATREQGRTVYRAG